MLGSRVRQGVALAIAALAALACPAAATAEYPAVDDAHFSLPGLFPDYRPHVQDYVVRCHRAPVDVAAHASFPWRIAVNGGSYHSTDFDQRVPLAAGRAFEVAIRKAGTNQVYRYHVRCLPDSFPAYTFVRYAPGPPQYFTADAAFASAPNRYAIIFDDHGVPVWWEHVSAEGPRVLSDGDVLLFHTARAGGSRWEIHALDGSLVRALPAVGQMPVDGHDLQLLPNGDYLLGAHVKKEHVDTSAYGGSSDADVSYARLQEVSPTGRLVWEWQAQDHTSLAETGRWWPYVVQHGEAKGQAYDVDHWNSIQPEGDSVIASFRVLDAIYKIAKGTGNVEWKLGGTTTPQSLEVKGDPETPTLGGQHDARRLSDGTITAFDNRTSLTRSLPDPQPRAVRYRIDPTARTATLLESITDPAVARSWCCGSARRLSGGDWLIDWAQGSGAIGGYEPDGTRTFFLQFGSTFSYRALPVPDGAVSIADLRQGMNAMCSAGCG